MLFTVLELIYIRSTKAEKSILQSSIPIPDKKKTLSRLEIEGSSVNLEKGVYEKPTINIIIYGKQLNIFPLKPGTRQGYSFSLLLLNILLEDLPLT